MKILIVGSLNSHGGKFAPFIEEQAEALRLAGCDVTYVGITGKGIVGYLKQLPQLRKVIREQKIDIIHAHYGLCGLLSCLAVRFFPLPSSLLPVVTTYHGSDINNPKAMRFSKIAMRLSAWNIFVSQRTMTIALNQKSKIKNQKSTINNLKSKIAQKSSLIPCGINLPKPANELPDMSHALEPNKKHVLFAGAFDNKVKDPDLAKAVVQISNQKSTIYNQKSTICNKVQLIELKGYTRDEVNALMYACDAFLMTSKTEGSPQVIKEAMACGCPIVSIDVGDVRERLTTSNQQSKILNQKSTISNQKLLAGCYVVQSRNPEDLADALTQALVYDKRTEGRRKIEEEGLKNEDVVQKLLQIYKKLLKK